MKEIGLTGKRRSTTIAATPDDGNSQRKRRRRGEQLLGCQWTSVLWMLLPSLHGKEAVCYGTTSL